MPVTARLSRRFYEQFGDELVTELVDWMNAVDSTYRSDLDRLNELNFARFDAKLEQRLAEQDRKLEHRLAALDTKWEQRLAGMEVKWEQRLAGMEVRWEQRISHIEVRMQKEFAGLRTDIVRWMFAFWTGTMLALAGFLLAIWKTRPGP
jgi:hypothetical protein